jgi:glucokinase
LSASEAIGVDLGGTKMLVGVVDSDRRVHHRSTSISAGRTAEELLRDLGEELLRARRARPDVIAAGLGLPVTFDQGRGVAISAVNLPIRNVPIRDLMAERLGLPVFIDNDANAAIIGEHRFGAARGAENALMLTIGTGIGGGLILAGRPYRGSTGAGAELGHIVVDIHGPPCQGNCPSNGCIEAVASGIALAREAREVAEREPASALGRTLAAGGEITGSTVTDAALAGDRAARDVIALIGRRIGTALAGLANAFEPEVIVLGGGVMAAGELLLGPARDEMRARALPPMNETPVVEAELGPEAGMIGAAALALTELEGQGK